MQTTYDEELIVLALAVGFKTEQINNQVYLVTVYKNKTQMFFVDQQNADMLCGKQAEILKIVDDRLGVEFKDKNIQKRLDVLYSAINDENHKFWDIAKNNLK